jgi:methylenetetrahydrofolate dehydrogenase (NADP+)/methenyltetrahydrofolate cyclohydrolase
VKDCAEVGFESSLYKFPSTASEAELLEKIEELNNDPNVDIQSHMEYLAECL